MKNNELHSPPGITLRRLASGESDNKTVTRFKNARRRRLRIRRMKYTCEAKVTVGNGGAPAETEAVKFENNRREIRKSMEILMSLSSSAPTEEENRSSLSSSERNGTVLPYGSVSVIGKRKEMEDAVSVEIRFAAKENINSKCDFFAVFDGHGGAQVAEMCRDRMHRLVAEELEKRRRRSGNNDEVMEWDWVGVMEGSFRKMDGEVAENAAVRTVGSTAVVAVLTTEEVVVANCGDCRAVLGRGGEAIDLSSDHKPHRADELMRIEEAGGRVINWNGQRVLGVLATSRSIGDQYLRPYVISKPEVTVTKRTSKDEFLIVASDGLWDVISSEAACHVVRKSLNGEIKRVSQRSGGGAGAAAALLTEIAIAKGSRDDISVIVIDLRGTTT